MKAVVFEQFGQLPATDRARSHAFAGRRGNQGRSHGLCRSDWHGWMGHDADIVLPHVPGHELAGTVVAVGSRSVGGGRRPGHRALRRRLRTLPECAFRQSSGL
jgi:D-arabinose 1-dehydrogenase-like Zn-dependent alcohol dehydrogenase